MPDTTFQQRLHAPVAKARAQLLARLRAAAPLAEADQTEQSAACLRAARRVAACGSNPVLYWDPARERLITAKGLCKARICPTCGKTATLRMQGQVRRCVAEMDSPRLMTLTLRSTDEPLAAQFDRLRRCFRRLRQRKPWKRHVQGGVMVLEVTWSDRLQRWHPHLHCVVDGVYWPQRELADLWEAVTSDSRVVDLRLCHSREAAIRYVSKYVSKTNAAPGCPDHRLGEWVQALHGLRLCQTFGSLHGVEREEPGEAERQPLEHVTALTPLMEAAADGDLTAQQLVEDIRHVMGSGHSEDHQRVKEAVQWWWATIVAERAGRPGPDAPSTPPPRYRQQPLIPS